MLSDRMVQYILNSMSPYLVSHVYSISFGIMPYSIEVFVDYSSKMQHLPDNLTKIHIFLAFLKKLSISGLVSNIFWLYLYFFHILVRPLTITGYKKNNQIMYLVSTGLPWSSWFSLQNFVVNLLNSVNLFYVWARYYPLPNLLQELKEIDLTLTKRNIIDEISFRKLMKSEWIIIGVTNLVTISCYALRLINHQERYKPDISYSSGLIFLQVFCYTKSSASISMFFAFFTKLRLRHKAINKKLKQIFEMVQQIPNTTTIKTIDRLSVENDLKSQRKKTKEEVTRIEYQLRMINQIYYELVVKQEQIMNMFKFDLLVGMAALSIGLGVDVFLILYKIMYSSTAWNGLVSFWQFSLIWNLSLTFYAGDHLYTETAQTRSILTRYNNSNFPDLIKTEVRCFILRIKNTYPAISVYSLYTLSFAFVPSLVAGMASYVVILLQYEWIKDIDK